MSAATDVLDISDKLTSLILETLIVQRREECHPSGDPDRMDDKIANCKRRVRFLRDVREQFEDEMSKEL